MTLIDRLRSSIKYTPSNGEFIWLIQPNGRVPVGSVAGHARPDGYIQIGFEGHPFLAHQLAWLHTHGVLPRAEIDHIDGDRSNNRLHNLREATHIENMQNKATYKNNTSGYTGVYWNDKTCKWHASIRVNGQMIHLGNFRDLRQAVAIRANAKAEHHLFQPTIRRAYV